MSAYLDTSEPITNVYAMLLDIALESMALIRMEEEGKKEEKWEDVVIDNGMEKLP